MIKILFLVETGHGMGHIIRCLNLAKSFEKEANVASFFFTIGKQGIDKIHYGKETITGKLSEEIIKDKVSKFNPDILIVDILDIHPPIPEILTKKDVITVTIFDFLSNEAISSDIIVNTNIDMINYQSSGSECLLGPRYMILGDCFGENKAEIKQKVSSVMISMGGSDSKDYTSSAIEALKDSNFKVDVVAGALSQNKEKVKSKISQLNNFSFQSDVTNENMCRLMLKTDILLSAAGNTMYEAASLGLPNIVFCNHQKHNEIATSFENRGVVLNLGIEPETNRIKNAINSLANDFSRRKNMSFLGKQLVDGKGGERITRFILMQYNRQRKD